MSDIIIFLSILIAAYLTGSGILSLIPLREERGVFESSFILPLGLAFLAYLVYLSGSCGLLSFPVIGTIFLLTAIVSVRSISQGKRKSVSPERLDLLEKSMIGLIIVFPVITIFGAMAPAIGTDSLAYHLGIPQKFILQNKIGFVPYTMNSLYPFFMEMLFTFGLLLKSAVVAKMFHWVTGILLLVGIYGFTREFAGRKAALLAALLVISSPGIFNEMVYAYVDVGLTLFISLSVFCMVFWMYKKRDKVFYLILSGVFMGCALSVKYLALYAILPVSLLLVSACFKNKEQISPFKILAAFVLPCVLLSFFWYLRSYLILGDPVFPVLSRFFNTPINFNVGRHFDLGMGKGVIQFLKLPWDLAMHPVAFGGRGSQIGIQFCVFAPFMIYGYVKNKGWFRNLLFVAIGYTLVWFFLVQRDRFLYPVLPIYGILIATSIVTLFGNRKGLLEKILSIFTVIAFTGITLFNLAICGYHNRHNYKVALAWKKGKSIYPDGSLIIKWLNMLIRICLKMPRSWALISTRCTILTGGS